MKRMSEKTTPEEDKIEWLFARYAVLSFHVVFFFLNVKYKGT